MKIIDVIIIAMNAMPSEYTLQNFSFFFGGLHNNEEFLPVQ